ncbi:MAG: glycosyltransferase family 2 protein [Gemmatimonadales bacterium]
MLPSVSIVIPTYGRPGQLAECLRSIAQLDYPRDRYEVIVVDDGGPSLLDPVVAPFRAQVSLQLIRQRNAGPSAARNAGAERASGEYLAFTDDDCLLDPGWLGALAGVWKESPDCMAGGLTLNAAEGISSATSQLIVDVVYRHYNADPAHARFVASNNMALPARAFRDIGGFDPSFRAAEDRDFCDRWIHRGHRIIYTPAAVVHHDRPMNVAGFCRLHFHYGRGAEHFSRRRAKRRSSHLLVEARFHLDVRNWLWFPLTSVPRSQVAPVAVLLGLWQVSNFAGFVWEALRRRAPRSRDGTLSYSA